MNSYLDKYLDIERKKEREIIAKKERDFECKEGV